MEDSSTRDRRTTDPSEDGASDTEAPARSFDITAILEGISDACVVLDREFRYAYVNSHAGEIFGRRPEDLLGRHIWTEFPEGVGQPFHRAYVDAFTRQVPLQIEAYYPPWDRWFENRIHPSPSGLVIFFQDVTERRAAETRARESERIHDQAERMAHLGLWSWDATTGVVVWSDELYRIYGLDPAATALSFESYLGFVHADDRARVRATLEQAMRTRESVSFDERIVRPNGEIRHLHSWGAIRVAADGAMSGMFGACLDTTDLVLATESARRSKEWLQLALDAARVGLWEWDLATNAVSWTDGVDAIFGLPRGTFAGTYEAYLDLLHPDDKPAVLAAIEESLAERSDYTVLHRIVADGRTRWIEGRGRVFVDAARNPIRMAGSVSDVTARTELEEQLRQSQKMEAIGRLAAGVAHDFNNLLTVILAMSDVVGMSPGLGDSARRGLDEIATAAQRASSLTRQLLALARSERQPHASLQLNDVVVASTSMLTRLLPENVALATKLAPELSSIRGDENQLEQIILNLVVNARDAMPDGGTVTLETSNVEVASERGASALVPGRYVSLTCRDTGTGMTEATRARLFEPFFTTKPIGKGTGLGLSTVYGIVQQMGGAIDVETRLAEGTTFRISFPALDLPHPVTDAGASAMEPLAARGERLLVVDDQDAVRRTVCTIAKALGYDVLEASDGESALRAFAESSVPVHGLVTDVGMPGMNGFELARAIRSEDPTLTIVFMSGYSAVEPSGIDRARTFSIAKPFTHAELTLTLQEAFLRR